MRDANYSIHRNNRKVIINTLKYGRSATKNYIKDHEMQCGNIINEIIVLYIKL